MSQLTDDVKFRFSAAFEARKGIDWCCEGFWTAANTKRCPERNRLHALVAGKSSFLHIIVYYRLLGVDWFLILLSQTQDQFPLCNVVECRYAYGVVWHLANRGSFSRANNRPTGAAHFQTASRSEMPSTYGLLKCDKCEMSAILVT
jgi:hypothetical protein